LNGGHGKRMHSQIEKKKEGTKRERNLEHTLIPESNAMFVLPNSTR